MNVVEEKIDALNSVLKVQIKETDYAEKVEKTLNDYRKQANIPGFRPGKTPMSLVKKKYGKGVLADELNKLVNESLNNYISKNNLKILGNPLPKEEGVDGDFDQPKDFEFLYEIGLSPDFSINLTKDKYDYLKIQVTNEMLDKEVENLTRRYGKLVSAEKVSEKDMVLGEFTEKLNGEIREGGVKNTSTISMEFIVDEKVKKQFIGKKIGDVISLDPVNVSKGEADLAAMLAVKKEDLENISNEFDFKITEIKNMVPADINQELFDKIFGEGNVKSEKELRDKIKTDLENMFKNDSDKIFVQKVIDDLIGKTKIDLPEDFLKRWMLFSSEENVNKEQIENDFDGYRDSLKWQLIQNKIIQDENLKVEPQEAVTYVQSLLINQYAQYGIPAPEEKELEAQAKNVLSNKDEANKIYDNLYGNKILQYFKETVKMNEKELPYEKFIEEAYSKK